MNNEELIVLQEEGCVASTTVSENESPEFAVQEERPVIESTKQKENQLPESTEQESSALKSIDACTCQVDVTQDGGNSPKSVIRNPLDRGISVDSITELDVGWPVVTLRIQSIFSDKITYAEIPLNDLTAAALRKCITRHSGMLVNWNKLCKDLIKQVNYARWHNNIKITFGHTRLGWSERADNIVFGHQKMISSDNQSSEYMGEIDIEPKGTLDNIVEMIKEWIISTPEWSPLEGIISSSVASVVLPFAKRVWGKNVDNMVVHLVGNSTTGKSTSLRLHIGLSANPFNEKHGFWINHQSSSEAIIRRIGNNQGLPVGIDELSSARKKEYTDFIYAFGNGEEKDRLKAGGTALCDSANFSTIALSSGEVSILGKCSSNTGIRARCVELCGVEWTNSKEQADAICRCLRNNYGWVAPLVAEELLSNSDEWKARWEEIYQEIDNRMSRDKIRLTLGSRISQFVVLLSLAAEIANKVLGIRLHVNEIRDFYYLHIITANADEANLMERAYEYLLRYVSRNPDEFPDLGYGSPVVSYNSPKKIKGFFREPMKIRKIGHKEYRRQIVFFEETFKEILEAGKFSPKVVSKQLHKERFLQTYDKDRDYDCLTYNEVYQRVYILYCNREDDLMFEAWEDGTYDPNGEEDYRG